MASGGGSLQVGRGATAGCGCGYGVEYFNSNGTKTKNNLTMRAWGPNLYLGRPCGFLSALAVDCRLLGAREAKSVKQVAHDSLFKRRISIKTHARACKAAHVG